MDDDQLADFVFFAKPDLYECCLENNLQRHPDDVDYTTPEDVAQMYAEIAAQKALLEYYRENDQPMWLAMTRRFQWLSEGGPSLDNPDYY